MQQLLFDLPARRVPTFQETADALSSIAPVFWRALEGGVAQMRQDFVGWGNAVPEPHVREMLVRFHAKRHLRRQPVEVEDETVMVGDEPLAALALRVGPISIRILKGRDGNLPGCGKSRRRRKFYSQQSEYHIAADGQSRSTRLNLVVLWDLDSESGLAGLWLACPRHGGERAEDVGHYWLEPMASPVDQIEVRDFAADAVDSIGDDLERLLRRVEEEDEDDAVGASA